VSRRVKIKVSVYALVKLIEAGRKESCASLPLLRHAGKEN